MPKKKTTTIVFDEKGHPFAVNRAARKQLAARGVDHTPVPMVPMRTVPGADGYMMNGDAFVAPYRPKKIRCKYVLVSDYELQHRFGVKPE